MFSRQPKMKSMCPRSLMHEMVRELHRERDIQGSAFQCLGSAILEGYPRCSEASNV